MQPASANREFAPEGTDTTNVDIGRPLAPVFKSTSTYTYELPNGKKCKIRFPTDEEWCARQRQAVEIIRTVGRGRTKSDTKGAEEANLALFTAIRISKDGYNDEFDEFEAAKIIGLLSERTVVDVRKITDSFQIILEVVNGIEVLHTLRSPSLRQVREFLRVAVDNSQTRRGIETRYMLEPSGTLWDKLVQSIAGYAGIDDPKQEDICKMVPIIHKDAAIAELITQIDNDIKGGPDPED